MLQHTIAVSLFCFWLFVAIWFIINGVFFMFLNQNICCGLVGTQKNQLIEMALLSSPLSSQKPMFKLMDKKKIQFYAKNSYVF